MPASGLKRGRCSRCRDTTVNKGASAEEVTHGEEEDKQGWSPKGREQNKGKGSRAILNNTVNHGIKLLEIIKPNKSSFAFLLRRQLLWQQMQKNSY